MSSFNMPNDDDDVNSGRWRFARRAITAECAERSNVRPHMAGGKSRGLAHFYFIRNFSGWTAVSGKAARSALSRVMREIRRDWANATYSQS